VNARTRAAAAAVCLLVTALLGWLTAYGVGLTGPSAPTGSTVEALPSVPPEADVWTPEFGQTLDLTDQRAGRATRPPGEPDTTAPAPAPAPAPAMTPAPTQAPAAQPTTAARSEPTEPRTRIVRQGGSCVSAGATARTRSGAVVLCTTKGNGPLRWLRA
jgi:pyruvate/2-oxoglutarate dehydrogenase complex dihydrolipoamide acyltransferase (E2) component